jgi:glycosyltransferase involved in cell wall biosynthesis
MAGTKVRTALIVDPSLRSADGHHLGVLERLRAELGKLQTQSISLASVFASEDLSRTANLIPTFEKSIYYRTEWTRAEFDEAARKFADDITRKMRKLRIQPDIVIFPAADQATVLGFANYIRSLDGSRALQPRIVLWLMMAPHYRKSIDDPSVEPQFREYGEAFRALRKAVQDDSRIQVCCETDAMARAYEPYVGLKIETAIVHKLIRQPRSRRARRQGAPINVVCTGNANVAKGYFLLPTAIDNLNRRRGDLRFLIHGTVEQTDYPEGRRLLEQLSGLAPNVTVRTDVLSTDDYLEWLSQADLLLQPYDPAVYKTRGSGVFAEATKLGIPVIAPRGCDFSRVAIDEGRAIGIDEFNAESLTGAVLLAVERLEETTARSVSFAEGLGVDRSLEAILTRTIPTAETRTN